MSFKSKLTIISLSVAIALYTVAGGLLSSRNNVLAKGDPYVQLKIFGEVLKHISRDYVDEPDMEKVRIGALRGLADGLDPYSAYLTSDQVGRFQANPYKANPMGLVLSKVSGFVYVISVLKGSPAEQAGLHNGDFIEYVGQIPTRDVTLYDVQETLTSIPASQEIEFTLLRFGKSEKIKIKQAPITQPGIENTLQENNIGYIKVNSLTEGKANEIKNNISALVKKGAQKIILDLRGTATGNLMEGVATANLFISSGQIAKIIGHQNEVKKILEADSTKHLYAGPVIILVNHFTGGPAEIVAAAILDNKRGEVVGEKTFGLGSEQELFKLQDGAGMLLTTTRYAPTSGKAFMDEPVVPSIEVKQPNDEDSSLVENDDSVSPQTNEKKEPIKPNKKTIPEDIQMKKALEIFKTNRPEDKIEKKAA